MTAVADEGATDPEVTGHAPERRRLSLLWTSRTAGDVSPSVWLKLVSFEFERSAGDFSALDELRTPEGQIRQAIRGARVGSRLVYRERLARRLEFLLEAMEEEGEPWMQHSPESLRKMLLFLESASDLRYPTVTVTPSATFRAEWKRDPNRHFAVDFLADGQVRFVVFSPDPRHPDRVQRVSGIASWENVLDVLEPYKVRHWAADAGA